VGRRVISICAPAGPRERWQNQQKKGRSYRTGDDPACPLSKPNGGNSLREKELTTEKKKNGEASWAHAHCKERNTKGTQKRNETEEHQEGQKRSHSFQTPLGKEPEKNRGSKPDSSKRHFQVDNLQLWEGGAGLGKGSDACEKPACRVGRRSGSLKGRVAPGRKILRKRK